MRILHDSGRSIIDEPSSGFLTILYSPLEKGAMNEVVGEIRGRGGIKTSVDKGVWSESLLSPWSVDQSAFDTGEKTQPRGILYNQN